jgi:hypothetical protein
MLLIGCGDRFYGRWPEVIAAMDAVSRRRQARYFFSRASPAARNSLPGRHSGNLSAMATR